MFPRWIVFLVPGYLMLVHQGIPALPKFKNILLALTVGTMMMFSIFQINKSLDVEFESLYKIKID